MCGLSQGISTKNALKIESEKSKIESEKKATSPQNLTLILVIITVKMRLHAAADAGRTPAPKQYTCIYISFFWRSTRVKNMVVSEPVLHYLNAILRGLSENEM